MKKVLIAMALMLAGHTLMAQTVLSEVKVTMYKSTSQHSGDDPPSSYCSSIALHDAQKYCHENSAVVHNNFQYTPGPSDGVSSHAVQDSKLLCFMGCMWAPYQKQVRYLSCSGYSKYSCMNPETNIVFGKIQPKPPTAEEIIQLAEKERQNKLFECSKVRFSEIHGECASSELNSIEIGSCVDNVGNKSWDILTTCLKLDVGDYCDYYPNSRTCK